MELNHLLDNIGAGADLLEALSHPVRLRILYFVENREMSVNSIVEFVGMRQSVVSSHLAKLREQNLVETRRNSRTILYTCKHPGALTLMREIVRLFPGARPTFPLGKRRPKGRQSRTKYRRILERSRWHNPCTLELVTGVSKWKLTFRPAYAMRAYF